MIQDQWNSVEVRGRQVHEHNSCGLPLITCHSEEDAKRAAAYINNLRKYLAQAAYQRDRIAEALRDLRMSIDAKGPRDEYVKQLDASKAAAHAVLRDFGDAA